MRCYVFSYGDAKRKRKGIQSAVLLSPCTRRDRRTRMTALVVVSGPSGRLECVCEYHLRDRMRTLSGEPHDLRRHKC
jgi:hypothetical protein